MTVTGDKAVLPVVTGDKATRDRLAAANYKQHVPRCMRLATVGHYTKETGGQRITAALLSSRAADSTCTTAEQCTVP